jgi:hypothetical protein
VGRRALAVTACERDQAGRDEHVDVVHSVGELECAVDQPRGLGRVVTDDDARKPGERGHQTLEVARGLGIGDRLLVCDTGESELTAPAVDVPEVRERIGDHPRADPSVQVPRCLEVRDRLVEAAQAAERLAAVRERQTPEGGEPCEVGEAQRQVELRDRLHVRALLEVA